MITAQQLCEDDWALWRTLRQAALAEAPGAFGSTLAEWTGAGDTEARWRARLVTVPFNVVARLTIGRPAWRARRHPQRVKWS